jgi:hypothetical protein
MWNRVVRVLSVLLGVALVVTGIWALVGQVTSLGFGSVRPEPQPLTALLLCVCHWTGVAMGFALLFRSPFLATCSVVAWAVFPLAGTIEALWHHWYEGPFQYRLLLLVAVPFVMVTRQARLRLLLPAIGVASLVYLVKDLLLLLLMDGRREEPLWVLALLGSKALRAYFWPTHAAVVGIGVVAVVAWRMQERWLAARARQPPPPPP